MKNRSGFTLIELLVVIAIIGILGTIATISLQTARSKARDARRVADIKQTQTALEIFYNDKNRYPTREEIAGGVLFSTSSVNGQVVTTTYMAKMPLSPGTPDGSCRPEDNGYYYNTNYNQSTYTIRYCIGSPVASIVAGVNCATPDGINAGSNCTINAEPGSNMPPDTTSATCNPSNSINWVTDNQGYRLIHNCCELQHIQDFASTSQSEKFALVNNINCATATTNNSAWNGWTYDGYTYYGFVPINTFDSNPDNFYGELDGRNAAIQNLSISNNNDSAQVGLFGVVKNPINFHDLSLSNFNIISNGSNSSKTNGNIGGVGGLVGEVWNNAIFTNCKIYYSHIISNGGYVGGLVGNIYGSDLNILFDGSEANDTFIDGSNQSYHVGGLVGEAFYSPVVINNSAVSGLTINGYRDLGGLIGTGFGTIANSIADNIIINVSSDGQSAGGLVGFAWYDVSTSISNSAVSSVTINANNGVNSDSNLGGVIGCASGQISSTTASNVSIIGGDNARLVGGLVGYAGQPAGGGPDIDSTIDSCSVGGSNTITGSDVLGGMVGYMTWPITNSTVNNITISGNLSSYQGMGGLAGYVEDRQHNAVIDNCHVTGNNHITGGRNLGGLVGYNNKSISNSSVENITIVGGVDSIDHNNAGGLLGYGQDSDQLISNCTVSGTNSISGTANLGGLVGYMRGNISSSTVSNITIESSGSGYDSGKYIGGLAGSIDNSSYTTDRNHVLGYSILSGKNDVGGLFGYTANAISNSTVENVNIGIAPFVSGNDETYYGTNIGGLLGFSSNSSAQITNCQVNGVNKIIGSGGMNDIGGLVGSFQSTISNSTVNNITITVNNNSYDIGGLAGSINGGGGLANCFVRGTNKISHGAYNLGGLVGNSASGDIGSCGVFNIEIHGNGIDNGRCDWTCHSNGSSIGGLVGSMNNNNIVDQCFVVNGNINGIGTNIGGLVGYESNGIYNSYFTGSVAGGSGSENYVGGLVGTINGTVSNSYAVSTVNSGTNHYCLIGACTSDGCDVNDNSYYNQSICALGGQGTAKTTTQMKNASTYNSWNIGCGNYSWKITEGSSYPCLGIDSSCTCQ